MNYRVLLLGLCAWASLPVLGQESRVEDIRIGGFVGGRIHTCIEQRGKSQDVEHLVEPFRHRGETSLWQSEFFGKWLLGAISSYEYCKDPALLEQIKTGVRSFMQTQTPEGYIGNYSPEARLTNWDIWGRKYSALALVAYYRLTGDKAALQTAMRSVDYLMKQLHEQHVDIARTGNYFGMASCSILEPVVYLYDITRERRYLDFAKSIVAGIEREGSSQLIAKALKDVPVSRRSAYPASWWSFENGQKAYEMMSCYEGLIELGRVLDDPLYKEAAEIKKVKGSSVAGDADCLLFPNIESGNVFFKASTHMGGGEIAAMVMGTKVPCVLTSRGDSSLTKLYSIALACLAAK